MMDLTVIHLNIRVLTQLIGAVWWLSVASFGLWVQIPNYRVARRNLKFWQNASSASKANLIMAQDKYSHNKGRLQAICINLIAGITILLEPFIYSIPASPVVPIAALMQDIVSFCFLVNEIILVRISFYEYIHRNELINFITKGSTDE